MREVNLRVHIPSGNSHTVFDKLGDFARYPELVDAVQAVTVHEAVEENRVPTDWVVYFRNGLLRWSEIDVYDHAARHITFEQSAGDFETFQGRWSVVDAVGGCDVVFEAEFDFGIPSLAGILEPIASRVLKENVARILIGVTGTIVIVNDEQIARAVGAELTLTAVA